jgi:5-(carboxyamino)imidazole ribonucleotide mutase
MPPGVPVATMAINGAKNAAIFAAQVIVPDRVREFRRRMRDDVLKSATELLQAD